MADEPSIDEILASLDRLLNEGDGRNDDIADAGSDKTDVRASERKCAESAADDAPEEEEAAVDSPDAMADADADEVGNVATHDARERDAGQQEAVFIEHDGEAHPRKLLLSETMLVESPQEALPFDGSDGSDGSEARPDGAQVHDASGAPDAERVSGVSAGASEDHDAPVVGPEIAAPDAMALDAMAAAVASSVSERLARVLPPLIDQLVREELAAHVGAVAATTEAPRASSETDSGRDNEQDT